MNKEGQLTMFERWDYIIMEEFGFKMDEMASVIIELREENEKLQKQIDLNSPQ